MKGTKELGTVGKQGRQLEELSIYDSLVPSVPSSLFFRRPQNKIIPLPDLRRGTDWTKDYML